MVLFKHLFHLNLLSTETGITLSDCSSFSQQYFISDKMSSKEFTYADEEGDLSPFKQDHFLQHLYSQPPQGMAVGNDYDRVAMPHVK